MRILILLWTCMFVLPGCSTMTFESVAECKITRNSVIGITYDTTTECKGTAP